MTTSQPLFNHQVAFPVLENLEIRKLPNIVEIWEKRLLIASENESKSCRLKYLDVSNCEKLVHVVRVNMLPRLQNLKRFKVDNCPKMEAIVTEEEKETGTTSNDVIVFSQLTTLRLSELESLKSFYNWPRTFEAQPLFNHQVAFPVLENLEIRKLPNIIEIWEKRLLIASENQSKSCRLKFLEVSNCEKLVHVVPVNMLPRLQNLKRFKVDYCPKMEAIVTEKEKETGTTSNDIIVFSQLTTLRLSELESLKSFYNWPTRFEAQPLFNHQVAFPVLKNLVIRKLPNIIEIWEKRLLIASENESKSCRLKDLEVSNCEKLVHVVRFNLLPRLQNLERFMVDNCPKMEAIVAEKEKETGTTSNDIILFSQLTTLNLFELVSLKSFYNWPARFEEQPLFNHQVAFPVLENLVIRKLPNIIEIWEKRLLIASENESKSCQLKDLEVSNCEKLVHVVRFNMFPRLQNLETFKLHNCPKMEAIVTEKEKERGTTNNDIILFSQLTTLNLFELVSLKSFYNRPTGFEAQPLFNHQVAFPVLENLVIRKLPNIMEIWEKRLLIASENESKSCRLKDLKVSNCEKLVHVVRFNMLPRLQNLERIVVDNCPKMEAVIAEKEKEKGTTSNDIIVFSQLTILNLSELVSLKSFYNWPTRFEAQPLFNHQVAFPVLENLVIRKLPNIIEMWEKRLHIASENESKSCQLKDLKVSNCEKLVHVVRFNMLPRLQNLQRIMVDNCPKMEAVVAEKEKEKGTTSNDIIVFPQLIILNLSDLVSLKSFYNWPTRFEAQPLFNHQVAFPVLENLVITKLPNIIEIWEKRLLIASENESKSCRLKDLKVSNCEKLVHVVRFNMLRRLQNLESFKVDNCPKMEAIVTEKEKETGTTSNDIIVFSQLTTLRLSELVSLKSFYNWPTRFEAQPLFNNQVAFPFLENLEIGKLPNIIEIWEKRLLIGSENESKSCRLKDLKVSNCEKLVHVVRFNMLPRLRNLETFMVDNCPKMEAIVTEKEKETGTTSNDIIVFSQLTTLRLSELVSLKSFYNWPTRFEAQPLFNHQVAFPVLESFVIRKLPNIIEIWEKRVLIASENESKSCRLKDLKVSNCEKLVHVVRFNMLPRVQNLETFMVDNCPKMEAIVTEIEKETGTTSNDIIVFSQLTTLRLSELVSLKSFYNWPTRFEAQPLFNHQIWEKRVLIASENESKSCRLKDLKVSNCEKLVYVVRFNMLPQVQNLETFMVDNCPKMEAIVTEKEKERGTTSNDIIVFSQLTTLRLSELVSLKSFYNWPTRFEAQPLFNHQVAFPFLENLEIRKLPNIIEIWEKRLLIGSENESKSCRLKDLKVSNCEKLVHVVRFNMLPRLQNLETFKVDNCPKMKAIVTEKEKETGTTNNDIIVFSQLTTLRLSELVSLKSFYHWPTRFEAQPLFNHQVAFPVLENLVIRKLPNIIEIWEKRLLIALENESKSCRLKDLKVFNCEKLVHVVRFDMLPRLQNLETFKVHNCPKMEAIVTEKEKETGTTSNDIIMFSQLTTLRLSELLSLKSFYNWPSRFEAQPLFNHQVAFPVLENLVIRKLPNIIEIWEKRLLTASVNESKSYRLKDLKVSNCEKLVHVVRFNMLPRLQNLETFKVDNCPKMEGIVTEKEKETGTTSNDIIVFSQLTTLNLFELVSLKSFYNWPTRFEAQPLFDHQ
ncbi:unnamed protein product [Camellia sinensis]